MRWQRRQRRRRQAAEFYKLLLLLLDTLKAKTFCLQRMTKREREDAKPLGIVVQIGLRARPQRKRRFQWVPRQSSSRANVECISCVRESKCVLRACMYWCKQVYCRTHRHTHTHDCALFDSLSLSLKLCVGCQS